MSRTALCAWIAFALALGTLSIMAARVHVMRLDRRDSTDLATRLFHTASVKGLPQADLRLVESLLLFPGAALIIVVFRNVVGLTTFGTFTPALLGLAFRDLAGWPGLLIFAAVLLIGWLLRRGLDRFQLLHAPRVSVMLCAVVSLLAVFVVASHRLGLGATHQESLFPLVILTGMIERLWTLEEEEGARASLSTLAATLFVALCVGAVTSAPAIERLTVMFPESVGLVAAVLLLLGRYTGYRLLELHRFRAFSGDRPETPPNLAES